jgi:hypothetical protein
MILDKRKIKTVLFSFAIQKNPPSVQADENLIPADYWIPQAPKLDRRALMEDLKAGASVPGAHLIQTESLRIR